MQSLTPPVRWVLDLLGPPRLRPVAGLDHPLSRKDAAWLLLVALDGPVASRRIAAAVWPGREPALAMTNLRQRLFRLRRQTGARLLGMGETLRLDADVALDPLVVDWLSRPLGSGPDPGRARVDGDRPWPPPLDRDWLAGLDYPDLPFVGRRLRGLRDRWDDLRVGCCLAQADREVSAGTPAAAIRALRSALAVRPLDEALHRRLIELHLASGDHAAAAAAFGALEREMRDALGILPSRATAALLHPLARVR